MKIEKYIFLDPKQTVRDNLVKERHNTKKAAKASAKHAKKEKAKKQLDKGKKKGSTSCAFPGHSGFVDICAVHVQGNGQADGQGH